MDEELLRDPILLSMVPFLTKVPLPAIAYEGGGPRYGFVTRARAEYRRRGGKLDRGGFRIAQALLKLRAAALTGTPVEGA